MKITRIALLAAIGVVVMTLPAAAAPAISSGGTDAGPAKPALMQVAQSNATRTINEARGGDFKKTKGKKKNTKRM